MHRVVAPVGLLSLEAGGVTARQLDDDHWLDGDLRTDAPHGAERRVRYLESL